VSPLSVDPSHGEIGPQSARGREASREGASAGHRLPRGTPQRVHEVTHGLGEPFVGRFGKGEPPARERARASRSGEGVPPLRQPLARERSLRATEGTEARAAGTPRERGQYPIGRNGTVDTASWPTVHGAGRFGDAPSVFAGPDGEGVENGRPCASPEFPAYEHVALSLARRRPAQPPLGEVRDTARTERRPERYA
jgi:hypothetical protein